MTTEQIRGHVIGLFEAFLAGDLDTLKAGRSLDWKGFQIKSTRLVRGVDDYMTELRRVMGGLKVDRYEFLEFDVDLYADIALVFHVARDHLSRAPGDDGPETVLIRSLDVYRESGGEWTQIASNICAIHDDVARD
ncbi:MAG: hypothetical protein WAL25_05815 [Acidimicrobiia bacterium]